MGTYSLWNRLVGWQTSRWTTFVRVSPYYTSRCRYGTYIITSAQTIVFRFRWVVLNQWSGPEMLNPRSDLDSSWSESDCSTIVMGSWVATLIWGGKTEKHEKYSPSKLWLTIERQWGDPFWQIVLRFNTYCGQRVSHLFKDLMGSGLTLGTIKLEYLKLFSKVDLQRFWHSKSKAS